MGYHRSTHDTCASAPITSPAGSVRNARNSWLGGIQGFCGAFLRSGGLACWCHRPTGRTSAVIPNVPPSDPAASGADRAAPRKPPALLLCRLRGDERASRLLDRELLRRQRRRLFTELRPGCEASETCTQSRLKRRIHARTAHPWTTAPLDRGGVAPSPRTAGLGYHGRALRTLLFRRLRWLADRARRT